MYTKTNIKTLLRLRGENKFKDFIIDYLYTIENFFEIKKYINNVLKYKSENQIEFLFSKNNIVNIFDTYYKDILSYTINISIESCFNKEGMLEHTKTACYIIFKDIAKSLKCENENYLF